MKPDLDSLATALYVGFGDLLKQSPQLAPWRPSVGIAPKLSDAELVTPAVLQALLGFTSERRWIRHARAHLRHLFPYLPMALGYNKRLRKAAALLQQAIRLLAIYATLWNLRLLRPARESEGERPGAPMLKPLRQVIESINETFKGRLDLERHRGRTPSGVIARVLQRVLTLTAAIWHNDHTGQPVKRALTAYDH
ncbi:hypothetical protein [Streptosporangium minutum]|uniref:hypothetical protein n=1 Tax=Streptosporangium minutum TaxID=569862 RepID=UPI000A39B155|nr:hypothetical protein [Streptosporangium minutum]